MSIQRFAVRAALAMKIIRSGRGYEQRLEKPLLN